MISSPVAARGVAEEGVMEVNNGSASSVGSRSNVNGDSSQCCHETVQLISVFFPQIYELRVMETKPDKAVSIIECDMNVSDFAAYNAFQPGEDRHLIAPLGQCPRRMSLSQNSQDYLGDRGGKCCQSIMTRPLTL